MRDTLGDTVGGFTLFLLCRHLENTLCQLGSRPPPGGCDIIKGENASLQPCLMKSSLCHHFYFFSLLLLAERLQFVPDESPGASWAEGRKGVPWSARSGRPGGRKGTSKKSSWQVISPAMMIYIIWHLLNSLLGMFIKYVQRMSLWWFVLCMYPNRVIQVWEVLQVILVKKAPRWASMNEL